MASSPEAVLALARGEGSSRLIISYQGQKVTPGQHLPKADATVPPTMKLSGESTGTFLAIALDTDAPYESFNIMSPILHLIQTDLKAGVDGVLSTSTQPLADWVQPNPPPFAGPHKYIIVLYSQPSTFDTAKLRQKLTQPMPLTKRIRWSLPQFVKLADLGQPVAANYFTSN